MSTIKVNSIVPNSGTHVSGAFTGTFSGSIENGRLDRLESFSSSLDAAFATDAQLTSLSASLDTRINAATNEQDLSGLATKVELNDFTASYSTDSASFADRLDNTGGGSTDISALNDFTGSYLTDSASFADRIDAATNEQDLSNLATTGSNSFEGNQNINGDLIITGSTLSIKKSTDSDPLFTVDVNSKRLGLVQGNGEIPGEFYLALSGSTAFFPRPDKTMFYGSRGFTFRTTSGIVSEFTNNRTSLTGSLLVSASNLNYVEFNTPRLTVLNGEFGGSSRLELVRPNNDFKIYANDASTGTWMISENRVKMMTPITQLSQLNDEPGIVNVIGKLNVTGSIGISGSIIPAVGAGTFTSSFNLGSPTAAWKDIYVSDGTINFLGSNGSTLGRLSATATGMAFDSDILVGTSSFGGAFTPKMTVGQGRTSNPTNVAIGRNVLYQVTPNEETGAGQANVGVGSYNFAATTTGKQNTAIGNQSLSNLTIGNSNVALGDRSGYNLFEGSTNTFIGAESGISLTNGSLNIGVGPYSLLGAVATSTNFQRNIAIGVYAGRYLSGSSSSNIVIGTEAGPQSDTNESNKLYIGHLGYPLLTGSLASGNLSLSINGATTIESTLTLKPQNPLPAGTLGSMAVSGSNLYFHNGTGWKEVLLVV
jgi:hypothetical protein